MMNGGNFGDGFLGGAINGGITGGVMGGIGHLRMQARISKSLKMSNGYTNDGSLPFDNEFLNEFAETNFGEGFNEKYGVSNLTTADNFRKQLGMEYNSNTGDLEGGGNVADAITVYNRQRINPMSDIYVSKSAFVNSKRLFTVLGHEFVHSLTIKWGFLWH